MITAILKLSQALRKKMKNGTLTVTGIKAMKDNPMVSSTGTPNMFAPELSKIE